MYEYHYRVIIIILTKNLISEGEMKIEQILICYHYTISGQYPCYPGYGGGASSPEKYSAGGGFSGAGGC